MSDGCITKWSERSEPRRLTRLNHTVNYFTVGRKTRGGDAKITHRGQGQHGTTRRSKIKM